MYTKLGASFCVGWVLSLAGGCDDQVEPGYAGESLLTVTGSVEIANSRARGELSPALGFRDESFSTVTIVDVAVRGTFPSDFRMELYEPPPKATLHHPTRQEEGEPLVSIGYITAVTSDHPDKVYSGNSLTVTQYDCRDEGRSDNLCLDRTEETCVVPALDSIMHCYVEKRFCPKGQPDSDQCVVETSGDRKLKSNDFLSQFAGLSRNYRVVYLADAAAPGSATAALLEAEAGVPAGYGLYEVRPISADEPDCSAEDSPAWKLATRYYNNAHDTNYKDLSCRGLESDPPHCSMPGPNDDILGRMGPLGEVNRLLEKAYIELGCPIGDVHYKRVDDPANTSISIVIDVDPAIDSEPPTQP